MSLGPYPEVSLAVARAKHADARAKVRTHKIDPLAEKRAAKASAARPRSMPTFGEVADRHLAAHQPARRNDRHRRQWFVALDAHIARRSARCRLNEVGTKEVLQVPKPVRTRAPQIASRLRGRIEAVLDAARALGQHPDPDRANPGAPARPSSSSTRRTRQDRRARPPTRPHPAARPPTCRFFMASSKAPPPRRPGCSMFAILCAPRVEPRVSMTWATRRPARACGWFPASE